MLRKRGGDLSLLDGFVRQPAALLAGRVNLLDFGGLIQHRYQPEVLVIKKEGVVVWGSLL